MIPSTKRLSEEYLRAFLDAYEYPEEAKLALCRDLGTLMASPEVKDKLDELIASYTDVSYDYPGALAQAKELFSLAGVGEYEGSFIFVAHLASTMKDIYLKNGISYDIWFDTLRDLKYKALECILIKKVWGTFVANWYVHFTECKIVAFGRLQFEEKLFGRVATVKGIEMNENTPILSVHIPTTGTPLDRESFSKSYAKAVEFFKDRYFHGEPVKFFCASWLLFPRHKEMLKPNSNILDFASDYELVSRGENADYNGAWRIFDCQIDPDNLSSLPEDNTMRRAYKALMLRGEKTGSGTGVYIPD